MAGLRWGADGRPGWCDRALCRQKARSWLVSARGWRERAKGAPWRGHLSVYAAAHLNAFAAESLAWARFWRREAALAK
jgi:hypothetical protein